MTALLSREQLEAYHRDGFVNAGQLLEASEVEQLRKEMERRIDVNYRGKADTVAIREVGYDVSGNAGDNVYQLSAIWMASEAFFGLIRHPKILQSCAELADTESLQVWSDQVMYKPAERGGPIPWHQDAPYFKAIEPAVALTAWVSLDDADVESGCMWMVPGSHKWGMLEGYIWRYRGRQIEVGDFEKMPPPDELPEIQAAWPGARPCPTRAGDVHFHHSLTWHGSPANRSTRVRRGYAIHYMPDGVRYSGLEDARVTAAGITTAGTPMRNAHQGWFPLVYDKGRVV